MASPTVLLCLLLIISEASAGNNPYAYYYRSFGGSLTFTPKGHNSDGTYMVELRSKQASNFCHVNQYMCFYGDCGSPHQTTSTVVSRSSYGVYWCQNQVVTKIKLNGNLPFGIRYPKYRSRRYGRGFWMSPESSMIPWNMMAHVDLGNRSDTGEPNRSPITTVLPYLRVTRNCPLSFNLTVFDPDGDHVRCRIPTRSSTYECGQCDLGKGFSLDQDSCSLTYKYSVPTGYHPIELVVEDFPNKPITLLYSDGTHVVKHPLSGGRHKRQVATTTAPTTTYPTTTTAPTTTYPTTTTAPSTTYPTTTTAPTTTYPTTTTAPTTTYPTTTTAPSTTYPTTTTAPTTTYPTTTTAPTTTYPTTTTAPITTYPTTTTDPTTTYPTTTTAPTTTYPTTTTAPSTTYPTTTTAPTTTYPTTTTAPTTTYPTTTTAPTTTYPITTTAPTITYPTTTTAPTTTYPVTTTTPTTYAITTTTPTTTYPTTTTAPTTTYPTTTTAPTTTYPTTTTAPSTTYPTTTTAPTTTYPTTTTAPTTTYPTTTTAPSTTYPTTTTAPTTTYPTTTTAPTTTYPTTTTAPTTTYPITTTAPTITYPTTTTAPTTTYPVTTTTPTTYAITTTTPTTTYPTTTTAPTTTYPTTTTAPTTTYPTTTTAPTTTYRTTTTAPTTTYRTTTTAPTTTYPITTTTPTTTYPITTTTPNNFPITTTTPTTTYPTTTTTATTTSSQSTTAVLSKLPLQFDVYVESYDAPSCLDGDYFPTFLSPTPNNGMKLPAFVNHTLKITVRSRAQYTTIVGLIVTGPKGISKQKISTEEYVIKWKPTENELNDHFPICFVSEAIDKSRRVFQSELRCVIADVGHKEATVTCNETTMMVEVEKTYLIRRNEDILHLNDFRDASCSLETRSNKTHLVAVMSLNSCGTTIEVDGDHIIFRNEISSADLNQVISRRHDVEIAFCCIYPKQTNLTLGFKHKNPYAFNEKGFGVFNFQFEFFESQRFRKQINASTYPVQVDLRQMMFMQIEMTTSIPNTELFVESCRATPYDNPNSRISYTIMEHGCVRDNTLQIYPSSKSHFRFGMEAFEFIGAHEEVYITCSVLLCETGVPGTRCSQGCIKPHTGIDRAKRAAEAQSSSHSISQGPLRLVKTSDSQASGPSLTLILNLVLVAGVLLVCGVVIYRSRRLLNTNSCLRRTEDREAILSPSDDEKDSQLLYPVM